MNTIEVIKNWIDKESEVLDLGCGDGMLLKKLAKISLLLTQKNQVFLIIYLK